MQVWGASVAKQPWALQVVGRLRPVVVIRVWYSGMIAVVVIRVWPQSGQSCARF